MKYLIYAAIILLITACSISKKEKIGDVYLIDVETKDTLYFIELEDINQTIEIQNTTKSAHFQVGVLKICTQTSSIGVVVPYLEGKNNKYKLKIPKSFLKGNPLKDGNVISYSGNNMLDSYQKLLSNAIQNQSDTSVAINNFIHNLFQFYKAYPNSGMVGYHVFEASRYFDSNDLSNYFDPKSFIEWQELSELKADIFSKELQRLKNSRSTVACKKHSPNKLVFQSSNSTIHPAVLEDHQKVIIFWATWCGPCKPQMKQLAELNERKYADAKVVFFAVSSEQDEKKLFEWNEKNWKKFGGDYLVFFHDKEYCMANAYEITQLPTILIFDKNDQLVKKYADLADVERIVDSLLRMK